MSDIKQLLAPFNLNLSQEQDFGTLLIHLRNNNISLNDAVHYFEGLKKDIQLNQAAQNRKQTTLVNPALICPSCNSSMLLFEVNNLPSNQVGEGLKSQWFCSNCLHSIFSTKTNSSCLAELVL